MPPKSPSRPYPVALRPPAASHKGYPLRRVLVFSGPWAKARWLDAAASLDAVIPSVRELGARFAVARGPNDLEGQAIDLHRFVRDAVTYVRDPSREEFSDSNAILLRGYGDCDDKARLFVALCRAISLQARIRPLFNRQGEFVHVQAEVRWPGSETRPDTQLGGWILAECILKDIALGQNPEHMPRDEWGRRLLS